MPSGVVKVFYRSKGYGFIRSESESRDIFVHRTAFEPNDSDDLRKGQKVIFDITENQDRLIAQNVRLLEDDRIVPEASAVVSQPRGRENGEPTKFVRRPITSALLERSLAAAVRKGAPECEAFVGVIIERVSPVSVDGSNFTLKGVRYGKANREKCGSALEAALRDRQQKFVLVDDPKI
jgi:CspA family cold shock protein